MSWIDTVKDGLPDYAKDIRLSIDAVLLRSTLDPIVAHGCASAAAFASGNPKLSQVIDAAFEDRKEADAALAAATIMAQNNVWYPYIEMAEDPALQGLPAGLRMNVIVNHGGTSRVNFEAYSLAASIVGKCHFCVKAHYDTLKKEGMTVEQLRDIGRIAAVISAASKVLLG
jgi:alkyl hydroperoxide reductase subunit D